jgi:cytoskeletal protein CcmA (bactofilin family)
MFNGSKRSQPARTNSEGAPSIISHSLNITGNLQSSGDVQIDGMVEGDITATKVLIGEGARVNGEIVADHVVIRGTVTGSIRGREVELARTAKVQGDIQHESLAIEAGAHVDGALKHVAISTPGGGEAVPDHAHHGHTEASH